MTSSSNLNRKTVEQQLLDDRATRLFMERLHDKLAAHPSVKSGDVGGVDEYGTIVLRDAVKWWPPWRYADKHSINLEDKVVLKCACGTENGLF